jgi:uncharacterized membrane protein
MNEKMKQKENAQLQSSRMAFDKILKICLIAGIIIVSGFIIYYILTPEPGFVTFGLLNSEQEAGDYRTNASISEDIEFYVVVENHLGFDFTFHLKIYKGDNQTQLSSSGSENANLNQTTAQVTINNEIRWKSDKLIISFLQIGSNQTIIVELWQMTAGSPDKFYDITWLRLNITV